MANKNKKVGHERRNKKYKKYCTFSYSKLRGRTGKTCLNSISTTALPFDGNGGWHRFHFSLLQHIIIILLFRFSPQHQSISSVGRNFLGNSCKKVPRIDILKGKSVPSFITRYSPLPPPTFPQNSYIKTKGKLVALHPPPPLRNIYAKPYFLGKWTGGGKRRRINTNKKWKQSENG